MKYLIALVAVYIACFNCCAQDVLDPQRLTAAQNVHLDDTNIYKPLTSTIVRGWNWGGGGTKLDSALHINMHHFMNTSTAKYRSNLSAVQTIHQFMSSGHQVTGSVSSRCVLNAQAMVYHPELQLDTTNTFKPMAGDSQGAVFGFGNKAVGRGGSGSDYMWWSLHKDSVPSGQRRLVLSDAWGKNDLCYMDYPATGSYTTLEGSCVRRAHRWGYEDTSLYQMFNGARNYVTLRIRVPDPNQLLLHSSTSDTLLLIRLPYRAADSSTGYIKYDSLPGAANVLVVGSRGDQRGRVAEMIESPNQPNVFAVTGAMLSQLPVNNVLTLSAFFYANGLLDNHGAYVNNPYMPLHYEANAYDAGAENHVVSMDIEVLYYGNVSIDIDYVRLETQRARELYFGSWDNVIAGAVSQLDSTWKLFQTSYHNSNPNAITPRIGRIYTMEEFTKSFLASTRYFNKLVGGLAACELSSNKNSPAHLLHATGFSEFWNGQNLIYSTNIAVPYYKKGIAAVNGQHTPPDVSTFHFISGYAGMESSTAQQGFALDTSKSEYETHVTHYNVLTGTFDRQDAFSYFTGNNSAPFGLIDLSAFSNRIGSLFAIEEMLYRGYYRYSAMLYAKQPWWANMWVNSEEWRRYNVGGKVTLSLSGPESGCRPPTGEECRLAIGMPYLLGAKGYLYFVKNCYKDWGAKNKAVVGVQLTDDDWYQDSSIVKNMPGDSVIYGDYFGRDWMDMADTVMKWSSNFDSTAHDWSLLDSDPRHIYIGMKSVRSEIAKMHQKLESYESELLSLKLQAWYGKGFTKMYSQQVGHDTTVFTDNDIIYKYINLAAVKTRPIGRVHEGALGKNVAYYEQDASNLDSGFYDITLLTTNTPNVTPDSVFYIGVANRRTNPLFSDTSILAGKMIFVPSAEFDMHLRNGGSYWRDGLTRDSSWWKRMYWKKLGCRELLLPFKYDSHPSKRPRLLHVVELVAPGTKGIDTIVSSNYQLAILMQPGEAKMLRITTLPSERKINSRNSLAMNGQRKLVAFPIIVGYDNVGRKPIYDSNKVRYYAVYHRPGFDTAGVADSTRRVYFSRSTVVDKRATSAPFVAGLEWENEMLISDTLIDQINVHVGLDCAYPSIVVRYDSISRCKNAYITYLCKGNGPIDPDTAIRMDWVAETNFEADSATRRLPQVIDVCKTVVDPFGPDPLENFGHPVINAHSDGQYICWADQNRGIVVGWQPSHLDSIRLRYTHNVFWQDRPSKDWAAQHPSVATYSIIGPSGTDCPLVWDESHRGGSPGPGGPGMIKTHDVFYTRLTHDSVRIYHHLDIMNLISSNSSAKLSYDTSIAQLSNYEAYTDTAMIVHPRFGDHIKPVVTDCSISIPNDTSGVTRNTWITSSIVHWEVPVLGVKSIFEMIIDRASDSCGSSPWACSFGQKTEVSVSNFLSRDLQDPSSTQGQFAEHCTDYFTGTRVHYNGSPSGIRVSMSSVDRSNRSRADIREMLRRSTSFANAPTLYDFRIGNVYRPQLSSFAFWRDSSYYNVNRRLQQECDNTYPYKEYSPLTSSAFGLMKASSGEQETDNVDMIGFNNGKSMYMLSDVYFADGSSCRINPIPDTALFQEKSNDSLVSPWFRVDADKAFNVVQSGKMRGKVKLVLQKRSNGRNINISNIVETTEGRDCKRKFSRFVNGANEEYRIVLTCDDRKAKVERNVVLDFPTLGALGKAGSDGDETIFDLESLESERAGYEELLVYPNPATNSLRIQLGLLDMTKMRVTSVSLVNGLGMSTKLDVNNGALRPSYNIERFSPGAYYLVVEYLDESDTPKRACKAFVKM